MSTGNLPAGVIEVPLTRQPFDVPNEKNSYSVAIRVLPPDGPTPAPKFPTPAPNPTDPLPAPNPDAGPVIHPCQVDTGSCGIVVPQFLFYVDGDTNGALLPGVTQGGHAQVTYHPSSDDLEGYHYTVQRLGIGAREDGSCAYVVENAEVIGAIGVGAGQGMMGVGFGRPLLGTNVFLNVPGMADGSVNPSFLLTETGIWLGYDTADLPEAAAYKFQQLDRQTAGDTPDTAKVPPPNSPLWQGPKLTIAVKAKGADTATSYSGDGLLDTGLNLMMIALDGTDWQDSFVGSEVTITLPGIGGDDILSYSFTVSGKKEQQLGPKTSELVYTVEGPSPMNPVYIVPLSAVKNFANIGINPIRGADYYFDAKLGQIGFNVKAAS